MVVNKLTVRLADNLANNSGFRISHLLNVRCLVVQLALEVYLIKVGGHTGRCIEVLRISRTEIHH